MVLQLNRQAKLTTLGCFKRFMIATSARKSCAKQHAKVDISCLSLCLLAGFSSRKPCT